MNENSDRITCSSTDLESDIPDAALSKKGFKTQNSRVSITVRSFRKLKSDPDGVSVKAAIDGIVARGILPDDSSEQIKSVTFETIKSREEKTIIEITQLDNKIP